MKKRTRFYWSAGLLVCVLLLLAGGVAYASTDASIPWWTADGGGGTSSGTGYSLSGTIGQADAGAMSGGNYSLAGGFWGGGVANPFIYLPLIQR
jgi:uncharacterized membrane protein